MCRIRFIVLCISLLLAYVGMNAQIRIIPRHELDSRANPRLSADSSSLKFDIRHIVAEPMSEDDAPARFSYRLTNVGKEQMHIKRLTSTCSCAVPVSDRRVIPPGETSVITVTYDPKGHPGKFERRIFLYTQEGNSPAAILKLSVDVKDSEDFSTLYRFRKGSVRLRRDKVNFTAGRRGVERIPFVNLSGKDLKLECDMDMLPSCLGFSTQPQVLKDRQEGEIIIEFDPQKGQVRESMMIILKDVSLTPSGAAIKVEISDLENIKTGN